MDLEIMNPSGHMMTVNGCKGVLLNQQKLAVSSLKIDRLRLKGRQHLSNGAWLRAAHADFVYATILILQ